MKLAVLSYVCDALIPLVEASTTMLVSAGHQIVGREKADAWIIASCALTSSVERRINDVIAEAGLVNKQVLLLGCMPELMEDKMPATRSWLSMAGVTSYMHLPDIIEKMSSGYAVRRVSDRPKPPFLKHTLRINPFIAHIPISEGCSSRCRFCVCRIARGSQVAYPAEKIVEAAQLAVRNGAIEIVLVGDDLASYHDRGFNLPSLIRKLCTISGDFRIKLGYMNPASAINVMDDLISAMSHPKVYKYLHINLQSASNEVLKSMARDYTKEEFAMLVNELRKSYPNATLETDIMVGYPTEDEEAYMETKAFLADIKPDILNINPFSRRAHMKMKEEIPSWKIKERYEDMIKFKRKLESESMKKWIGWKGDVVVIDKHNKFFIGRNFAYRNVLLKHSRLGSRENVTIKGMHQNYLIG